MVNTLFRYLVSRPVYNIRQLSNISHNMVAPRAIATELLKGRLERAKKKGLQQSNYLEFYVIGSNCDSFKSTFIVNSNCNSYMFNCNEGLQRLNYSRKLKIQNISDVFVTEFDWNDISGIFGLTLTLQDLGCPSLTLRGAGGLGELLQSSDGFMSLTSGIKVSSVEFVDKVFQDNNIKITPIPIDTRTISSEHKSKRFKRDIRLMAYSALLPDMPGKLDAQKCRQLKVPIGPLLAKLKAGEDVTLPDGRLIKSSDVTGPPAKGIQFLVIDCPTLDHIDAIKSNERITELQSMTPESSERPIDLVMHLSPDHIVKDKHYMNWIQQFPTTCKHLILNHKDSNHINFIDSYQLAYLHNTLDDEIFPQLYLTEKIQKEMDQESIAQTDTSLLDLKASRDLKFTEEIQFEELDRVTYARSFDRLTMRPAKVFHRSHLNNSLDIQYKMAKLIPTFEDELKKYKEASKGMPRSQVFEPEVVFLGTGSAVPSKYRNTSCILLNFSVPQELSVILDCGEDSYGQLSRHYGPSKLRDVLKRLKMVYVSHHHADHHIGLIKILRSRSELTDEPLILLLPSGVIALLEYYNNNVENISHTYRIFTNNSLRSRSTNPSLIDNNVKSSRCNLIKSMGGFLDEVNLVPVQHCYDASAVMFKFNISRPEMKHFSIAYSGDARPSDEFVKIGQGCDLLIHEATFDHKGLGDALLKKHSTTHEAIEVGRKMNAKFTVLTHFSQKFSKIPYFTSEFDDKVGFAMDHMTLKCPSHFARLPAMKNVLLSAYEYTLERIDETYEKKKIRCEVLEESQI